MRLAGKLYSASRAVRNVEALRSTSTATRRAKNAAVGRAAAKGGLWRALFGSGGKR